MDIPKAVSGRPITSRGVHLHPGKYHGYWAGNPERRTIKDGGRLLVVAEPGCAILGLPECFCPDGGPASSTGPAPAIEPNAPGGCDGAGAGGCFVYVGDEGA